MHLGTSNGHLSYHMHQDGEEVQLRTTELEKDLDIYMDPGLTFSSDREQKMNKVNKLLGMIRRSYTYLDNDMVTLLCMSLIQPHIEYGTTAWTLRFKKDMSLIENAQRRATKLLPAIKDLPHEDCLRILNLPSLYYRRARGDIIETFKHIDWKICG